MEHCALREENNFRLFEKRMLSRIFVSERTRVTEEFRKLQ
jgi:hypothetical protein